MKKTKASPFAGPPGQVVVILKEDAGEVLQTISGAALKSQSTESKLQKALSVHGVTLTPLFGDSESHVTSLVARLPVARTTGHLAKMQNFYTIASKPNADLDAIVKDLLKLDMVDGAYVKPMGEPPVYYEADDAPGNLAANGSGVPITTSLTGNQTYLNAAPGGVDALYAWTVAGGRGDGVNIVDVEGGWNMSHEDLAVNNGGIISGFNHTTVAAWFQHGTAVLGEMGGDANTFGVTGICPNARIRTVSVFTNSALAYNSAGALRTAADALGIGDVLLIEQHRPGPNYPGGDTQMGFIAIEWWPDDFLAIQYATSKGVIVVEAAGNGSQDLDAAVYNTRPAGFPAWWVNPFRRAAGMDCGAILVGAGAPPPGTNGGNWGVDRSRLDFSNFGACLDVQGWGRGVTTTGYGDVHGVNPNNMNEWYTNTFAGTSSASPIVTGTVASLQGIQKAARRPIITPARMRSLFRSTGSPQQAGVSAPLTQRIGNRPDLRALVAAVAGAPHWAGVQFTGVVGGWPNPNLVYP